jgi:hypothetical protein
MAAIHAIGNASSWAQDNRGKSQPHDPGTLSTLKQILKDEAEFSDALTALKRQRSKMGRIAALDEALSAAIHIPEPGTRVIALIALIPYLPTEKRASALDHSLNVALAIDDAGWRADILFTLVDQLPKAVDAEVLERILAGAKLVEETVRRAHILQTVAGYSLTGTDLPWNQCWRAVIEDSATRGRDILISDLSAIGPVIFRLGGNAAIQESIQALLDVGRWWP